MNIKLSALLSILISLTGCSTQKVMTVFETNTIKIQKLASSTYIHTSYLQTTDFGNVPCNGMFVVDNGEALVFDTPTNDTVAVELIKWIETNLKSKIVGIVATHFHSDCLGGLQAFHDRSIPSYANNTTIEFAKSTNKILPQSGFENFTELNVGNHKVICEFPGEGHTKDNIIGYFPNDKVLFGGCLIKSMGAGKGNLEDANTEHWPKTVENLKTNYDDAEIVIPGHGQPGGQNLLDYTIKLFK